MQHPIPTHCDLCGDTLTPDWDDVTSGICATCEEEAGEAFDQADITAARAEDGR